MEIQTDLPIEPTEVDVIDVAARLEDVFSTIFAKNENDLYFRERINEAGELHIDDICKAPQVLEITTNVDIIKNAIGASKNLRVCSETAVKSASAKLEQNTLIIREIPSTTPSGDILQIFTSAISADGTPCPAAQSVRSDMNDTWFVTFHSEAEAKTALSVLRQCKFAGKPVLARLKTESTLKSFYSAPNSAAGVPNKGGGYSPRNPNSGAPSPINAAPGGGQYSPSGAPQGAFFSSYPVPPPPYGGGQGPPSAYANVLGPDGKPGFPVPPNMMFAPPHPGQQGGFGDGQHFGAQQGYQFQGNRRYQRSPNNNFNHGHGGYQQGRSPGGGYRNNNNGGGRGGQRPGFAPQQNMSPRMGGYIQPAPMMAVPPVAAESSASDGTPRSGAGSTTVDGSSPDTANAVVSGAGVSTQGAPGSTTSLHQSPQQSGLPAPLGINIPPPLPGQNNTFMNFGPPGAPPFFPNFAFPGGMPMGFPGFAPGMLPAMSPVNFAGQMPPGYFPVNMGSPLHHLAPQPGFPAPPHPPFQHASAGAQAQGPPDAGAVRQQKSAAHNGSHPGRGGNNSAGAGGRASNNSDQAGRSHGGRPANASVTTTAEGAIPAESPERKATSGAERGNRDRKNSGGNIAEKEGTAKGTGEAGDGHGGGGNGNRRRVNSTQSDATARKSGGGGGIAGAGGADASHKRSGERNGERSERGDRGERGGGDRKKSGKDKGRGEKSEAAAAAPKRADFNMDADFPTLPMDADAAEKPAPAMTSKVATFDYASAARKAAQPSVPPGTSLTAPEPAERLHHDSTKREKGAKKADKAISTSATLAAAVTEDTKPAEAKTVAPVASTTAAVSHPPIETNALKKVQEPAVSASEPSGGVESFTFGSVVAPVVNSTDRSGMHFGTSSSGARAAEATHGSATSSSTATSSSSSATQKELAPASVAPAVVEAPKAAAPVVEVTKSAASWGAKKSFADILQQSERP